MSAPNFTLITELQTLHRRDFPLADITLANPLNSDPLLDGEFLELNANYQLQRGATGEGIWPNVFPVYSERGRYDVQALQKVAVLMLHSYEAETAIYTSAGLVVGSALTVNDVTYQGGSHRGLALASSSSGRVVVGYVSRIVAGSGVIRFIHYDNVKY